MTPFTDAEGPHGENATVGTTRHAHRGRTDRSAFLGALGFVAEILLFAGVGVAAFQLVGEGPSGTVIAVSAVVATVITWAVLVSPGSSHRLATLARAALVIVVGGAATATLAVTGSWIWPALTAVATAVALLATLRTPGTVSTGHVSRHGRPR